MRALPFLLAAEAAAVAPIEPVVVAVPEATTGPPAHPTCAEARAAAGVPAPPEVAAPPRARRPEPAMAVLEGGDLDAVRAAADPDRLPPAPLEGRAEDIARVGAVLRRAAGGERVRLSFFGASHVAGEWWTGHIRRRLQAAHGDAGHGFAWPAALYAGTRAQDLNLCRSDGWRGEWPGRPGARDDGLYGFSGGTLSSADPRDFGWLETTHANPQGRRASRFDVWVVGGPEQGTLEIRVDDAPPRRVPTRAARPGIGLVRVEVPDGPHRLVLRPAGDGEVRLLGVSAERDVPGVIVDGVGIPGRTAASWLRRDPDWTARALATLAPDLVVLAYGTNEADHLDYDDATYRADLRAVLGLVRRALPDAACVLVGPSDRGRRLGNGRTGVWPRTGAVAQVQREVGPEFGCATWDWQRATGGPGSMVAWRLLDPPLAARDLVHFTRAGYERSAELFLGALYSAADLPVPAAAP